MKILITGGAGFIGYHLAKRLMAIEDNDVVLLDIVNEYYDVNLKNNRLNDLKEAFPEKYRLERIDLTDEKSINSLFENERFDVTINLAAQAGVRYARENPSVYIKSNVDGFFNVIDAARRNDCQLVIYASSSSVYGGNTKIPFEESDKTANPLSVYAASKQANESIANSYMATFGLKAIGLRFFNVYGPWGRPDAVYYKWSDAITDGTKLDLRDNGEMYRDMTYINDVVRSIEGLLKYGIEQKGPIHEVFNIGNENPVKMGDLLEFLTAQYGMQPSSIDSTPRGAEEPVTTRASTDKLKSAIGYAPNTPFEEGVADFVSWYRNYYSK